MAQKLNIILLLVISFIFSWTLSWSMYQTNSFAYHDLGMVNYFVDSTMHGLWMRSPLPEDFNHFYIHFHPTILLLLPFKFLWPNSFIFILGHNLAQALSILPLFLYARKLIDGTNPWSKFFPWLMVFYFFSNPFSMEAFMSGHFEQMYIAPMLGVFASLALGHRGWAWICLVLAYGVRDDYAFLAGVTGLMMGVCFRRHRMFWLKAGVLGIAWFLLARSLIMPFVYNPNRVAEGMLLKNWQAYGNSIPGIIWYFLTHPFWILQEIWQHSDYKYFLRQFYWLPIFSPFGFGTLVPMAYLTTYKLTGGRLIYYYSCCMLPYAFAGVTWVLAGVLNRLSWRIYRIGIVVVFIGVLASFYRNYFYKNASGNPICYPWNCNSRYVVAPDEAFANEVIEQHINQSSLSAAVTFQHFGRAKWRRELYLTNHAMKYKPCLIFADVNEAKTRPFLGTGNLIKELSESPEYLLKVSQGPYFLFVKKECLDKSSGH